MQQLRYCVVHPLTGRYIFCFIEVDNNMAEPIVTVGLGAIAAYIGKDGIQKILGPTADYLGNGLRDFTQKRIENVGRIFQKAESKLGNKESTEGSVPPKVLKAIVNDGSYNDDEVALEYLGGVLASSKTEFGRDDRGARMARIVDDMSTYQLRTHYLIYSSMKQLFKGQGYEFNMDDRPKMEIYIEYPYFAQAMEFTPDEMQKASTLLRHILFGLQNDGLIGSDFQYGPKEHMVKRASGAQYDGFVCQPSALGAELFLWAFGEGDKDLGYIFDDEFSPKIEGLPSLVPQTLAVKKI